MFGSQLEVQVVPVVPLRVHWIQDFKVGYLDTGTQSLPNHQVVPRAKRSLHGLQMSSTCIDDQFENEDQQVFEIEQEIFRFDRRVFATLR
jgi:hypothetical protein